ncbi:MAG: hypothetical protein HXK22_01750 [Alloprevotella tannerae]|nr:hypothetical protein [Alloprevotella tannerae]
MLVSNYGLPAANDSLAGANHTKLRLQEMKTKGIYLIISEKYLSLEKVP